MRNDALVPASLMANRSRRGTTQTNPPSSTGARSRRISRRSGVNRDPGLDAFVTVCCVVRSEDGAPVRSRGCGLPAGRFRPRPDDPKIGLAKAFGLKFSQYGRHGRGFRQKREDDGLALARLGSDCRDRVGDPESRKTATTPAIVPAGARRGRGKRMGFKNDGAAYGVAADSPIVAPLAGIVGAMSGPTRISPDARRRK